MHEKPLEFGRIHKTKYFFCFFLIVLKKNQRKTSIFNTGFVSYSVGLQLDIMQNCWKNM